MSYSGGVMDVWVDVEACMKFSFLFHQIETGACDLTDLCSTHEEALLQISYVELTLLPF